MERPHIRALRHRAFYSPLLLTIAGGFLREEGVEASHDVAGPGKGVAGGTGDGSAMPDGSMSPTPAMSR